MRLLTHNTLQSPLTFSYPLRITATEIKYIKSSGLTPEEGEKDFVKNLMEKKKLEWSGVVGGWRDLKEIVERDLKGEVEGIEVS